MIIHHVGVVVQFEKQVKDYLNLIPSKIISQGYVQIWDVNCIFVGSKKRDPMVEFIIPLSKKSELHNYNSGRGGIHHIAYAIKDLDEHRVALADKGIQMLMKSHIKGAGNFICNFVSPVYAGGVITEFIQYL